VSLKLRSTTAADAGECGRICYHAFAAICRQHGFPPDFPSTEVATDLWSGLDAHPDFFSVVAERSTEKWWDATPSTNAQKSSPLVRSQSILICRTAESGGR
jgi:hypothetical protein